jgi:hypothetical protein
MREFPAAEVDVSQVHHRFCPALHVGLSLLVWWLAAGSCAGTLASHGVGRGPNTVEQGLAMDAATLQRVRREAAGKEVEERFSGYARKHRDLEYRDLLGELGARATPDAGPGFDPTQVAYWKDIASKLKLTPEQRSLYQRTGLLALPGGFGSSMGESYLTTFRLDLPVLITSDSILHALHRSFDSILLGLELRFFGRELEKVLDETHRALAAKAGAVTDKALRESLADVDLYLTVARRLLAGEHNRLWNGKRGEVADIKSTLGNDAIADELMEAVAGLKMNVERLLFGEARVLDFSQFKPRGHYTDNPMLQCYFRAMMWLGRADLGFSLDKDRGLRAAALMSLLLVQSGQLERLSAVDRAIQFLVGVSDNTGPVEVAQVLTASGLDNLQSLASPGGLAAFKQALRNAGLTGQLIRSQYLEGNSGPGTEAPLPDMFQVFGQRFIFDSFVLSKLVFDAIRYHDQPVERTMPTGLDVMAALGNNEAVLLLEPELEKWHYASNLLAARLLTKAQPPETWNISAYSIWLSALGQLGDLPTGQVPAVMRSQVWQRKQLQTQLASWAELRHDTILYAKQSYTGGVICEYPAGYVEPYPELYARLAFLAEQERQWLEAAGFSEKHISEYLQLFAATVRRLERLARKELAGQPFDRDEIKFIKDTIHVTTRGGGCAPVTVYTGWYAQLFYNGAPNEWNAIIADVHTDPNSQHVLEVATGGVDLLVAAIDNGADRAAYVGPIYSYYEFAAPERLTDEEWRSKIFSKDIPERPPWIRPLLAPSGTD